MFAAVIFATYLRIQVAQSDPLWLDELHTVWAVRHDGGISDAAAIGNQTFLYFSLLKPLVNVEESTPISFRWFSIICNVGTLVSIGLFAWYWTRSLIPAALSIWLAAIEPMQVFYATEARPYAALMLVSVWHVFWVFRLWIAQPSFGGENGIKFDPHRSRKSWGVFFLLTILLMYLHYSAILLIGAEVLIVLTLIIFGKLKNNGLEALLALTLVPAGCLLAQFSGAKFVFGNREQWSNLSSTNGLLDAYQANLTFLVVVPLILLFVFSLFSRIKRKQMPVFAFCILLWAMLPAILAACCHLTGIAPLAIHRYTLMGAVGFPVFAGFSVSLINDNRISFFCACLVFTFSVFCPLPFANHKVSVERGNDFIIDATKRLSENRSIRMRYESWDAAVSLLKMNRSRDVPIFLFGNILEDEQIDISESQGDKLSQQVIDYLKFPLASFGEFDTEQLIPRSTHSGSIFGEDQIKEVWNNRACWLVIRGDESTLRRIVQEATHALRANGETYEFQFYPDPEQAGNHPEWLTVVEIIRAEKHANGNRLPLENANPNNIRN